jgi:hypothetical protein
MSSGRSKPRRNQGNNLWLSGCGDVWGQLSLLSCLPYTVAREQEAQGVGPSWLVFHTHLGLPCHVWTVYFKQPYTLGTLWNEMGFLTFSVSIGLKAPLSLSIYITKGVTYPQL